MLELINVCYSYGSQEALNSVSLKIEKGESVSLLGSNGCGKSTLLKIINGLIFPESGKYIFDGKEISKKSMSNAKFSKEFFKRMGFVFQNVEAQLFCADVYDEIAFGLRQMGKSEDEAEKRVEDAIKLLKLEGFEGRVPYHLSGGEKKKVALAAVLASDPEVLVLDEPLNGLDPRTSRWLSEFLQELNASGVTLIISTHNLDMVQEMSGRAVLFDESHRIAADMPAVNLLDDIGLLKRVNLVDEFYHKHSDSDHSHFHLHGRRKQ
jgi:cobalt/nickel transport system ATP-binding protein